MGLKVHLVGGFFGIPNQDDQRHRIAGRFVMWHLSCGLLLWEQC